MVLPFSPSETNRMMASWPVAGCLARYRFPNHPLPIVSTTMKPLMERPRMGTPRGSGEAVQMPSMSALMGTQRETTSLRSQSCGCHAGTLATEPLGQGPVSRR